jgi:hypothetical protein
MPVRCYGQLKDHAHDGDTSHRMFTIHNIMPTLTTRFSSLHKYHAKGFKSLKQKSLMLNKACLTSYK